MGIWLFVLMTSVLGLVGLCAWFSLLAKSNSRWLYFIAGGLLWSIPLAFLVSRGSAGKDVWYGLISNRYIVHLAAFLAIFPVGSLIALIWGGLRRDGRLRASYWPSGKLFTASFVLGLLQWGFFDYLDRAAVKKVTQLRAATDAAYLQRIGPFPAETQNAAILYREAFAQIDQIVHSHNAGRKVAYSAMTDPQAEFLNSEFLLDKEHQHLPESVELIDQLDGSVQLLNEASRRPDCRFIDFKRTPNVLELYDPKDRALNNLRLAARVLAAHARLMVQRGQINRAINDINAMTRLSKHVCRSAPSLVSGLVEAGIGALTIDCFFDVVIHLKDLRNLQSVYPQASEVPDLEARTYQGEKDTILGSLLSLGEGNFSIPPQPASTRGASAYRLLFLENDIAIVKSSEMVDHRSMSQGSIFLTIIAPSLKRAREIFVRYRAACLQADIAVAVCAYRQKHGRPPASLDELTPEHLKSIPADPFDGQPMRYQSDGVSVTIYSVGEDRKDDGGQIDSDSGRRMRDVGQRLSWPGTSATRPAAN